MLGVLLESRARRQRRSGGMTLSVIVHLAIITASVAGTTIAKPAPKVRPVEIVKFTMPPKPDEPKPREVRPVSRSTSTTPTTNIVIKQIEIPVKIPVGIPDIELPVGPTDSPAPRH